MTKIRLDCSFATTKKGKKCKMIAIESYNRAIKMGPIFELVLIYFNDNDMKLALSLSLKYIKLGGFNNLQNIIGIIKSIIY